MAYQCGRGHKWKTLGFDRVHTCLAKMCAAVVKCTEDRRATIDVSFEKIINGELTLTAVFILQYYLGRGST